MESVKNKDASYNDLLADENDEVEIRPIRRRDAVEAGLDYWESLEVKDASFFK